MKAFLAPRKGVEVAEQILVLRSYYSAEEGKIYCEYETPSAEAVFEHAKMADIPLYHAAVVQNLEPSMFR